ncbi:MAG: hypothetical protein ABSF64_32235 [Bryobacteraceae bacterium]|jgi:hypothetical protein
MNVEEEFQDVLQNIEFGIIQAFRADGSLLDLDANDAVAALIRRYRAEQEQRTPPPVRLGDKAQRIFDSTLPICEWRLGREGPSLPPEMGPAAAVPNTPDDIVTCLKRIQKSIDFWNKRNGRQGYLSFVAPYVP